MSENLEKIARSNYLLWKIRKILNLKGEYYAKWEQVSYAFNGGFFYDGEKPPLSSVYFHDLQHFRDDLKPIQIGEMLVSIGTQQDGIDWQILLKQANKNFDLLLKEKGESILSQVNRFLLFLGCFENQENPQRVKSLREIICADFPNSTIYPLDEVLPFGEPLGNQHDFSVEVVFDEPISTDKFVKILKKHLPDLRERIFGYGYKAGNPVPEIQCWITLCARQF